MARSRTRGPSCSLTTELIRSHPLGPDIGVRRLAYGSPTTYAAGIASSRYLSPSAPYCDIRRAGSNGVLGLREHPVATDLRDGHRAASHL